MKITTQLIKIYRVSEIKEGPSPLIPWILKGKNAIL
jgi:hypothetical protein